MTDLCRSGTTGAIAIHHYSKELRSIDRHRYGHDLQPPVLEFFCKGEDADGLETIFTFDSVDAVRRNIEGMDAAIWNRSLGCRVERWIFSSPHIGILPVDRNESMQTTANQDMPF